MTGRLPLTAPVRAPVLRSELFDHIQKIKRVEHASTWEQLIDYTAIELFGIELDGKMRENREKGRGGWHTFKTPQDIAELQRMLAEHVEKGDPRDVALIAMMLWAYSAKTA